MYRIAVCDDNPEILTQVCTTLSGSPLGKELELTPFHSGAALAAALRSGARFALLILDIELDTVDGVAIGRLLREELRDSVTQLLYISGQQQYAMALFDTRPLNFFAQAPRRGKAAGLCGSGHPPVPSRRGRAYRFSGADAPRPADPGHTLY